MKKLFSIFSVALFAVILLSQNIITADAADPTTYIVKYDSSEEEWYYQVGSAWDDSVPPPRREVFYMFQEMKDGDYVVVESTDHCGELTIDFHLGNLTILPHSTAIISCKSVVEYYQLHDSTVALNANVEKAYVYDHAVVNFNNNVNLLKLICENEPTMVTHVLGTCNEFHVYNKETTKAHLWNFTEPLKYNQGSLSTPHGAYAINPPATPTAPIVPSTTTTPPI